MLEKRIKNKGFGLAGAVLALSVSGCAGMNAGYFKPRKTHEVYYCGDDMKNIYCDGEYIYHAVVIEAR